MKATDLAASSSQGISPVRKPVGFLWFFGLFWSSISLFIAFQTWTNAESDWKSHLFISIFVLIGLAVISGAIHVQRKNWQAKGAQLFLTHPQSYAGEDLSCELIWPAKYLQNQAPADLAHEMQLVQYEEDRSGSGVSHIRVHAISQMVMPSQLADGRWRLSTQFDVPHNAPASGSVRNGNKVYWQIESVHSATKRQLEFPVNLRAARLQAPRSAATQPQQSLAQAVSTTAADQAAHWPQPDGGATHDLSEIEPLAMGESPMVVSASVVRIHEDPQAWTASFPRRLWKAFSLALMALAVYFLLGARSQVHAGDMEDLFFAVFKWLFVIALFAATLHAWTKHWRLVVSDDGFAVDTSSALKSSVAHYSAAQAQPLIRKHAYDSQTGSSRTHHFSLAVRREGTSTKLQAITPALPGLGVSAAVAHHFWQAQAHRRMRFAADGQDVQHRLGSGWAHRLGAWMLLSALAVVSGLLMLISPNAQMSDLLRPGQLQAQLKKQTERVSAKGFKHEALLKAHRYNNPKMVAQALAGGADANALNNDGVSLLIEAADSGNIEIVRAHLTHGADVNTRNTASPNKLDDTPLLVALYRGHWGVAQLLIASGADLKAKNRWDWGTMHMAAQSDCIPCLEGMLARGFSPNEPAPASRGESPVMLAAGRDKLPALKWLVANGGSLQQKDPQGQNALAWAEFFKRSSTAAWIRTQPATTP